MKRYFFFFFQAEDGIRDLIVTGVQTCALPISRHIQHALIQLGERMSHHDAGAARWYPEFVRLASHPVEEVRNTDAWVMGQDTSGPTFHETLLKMLQDPSPMVRGNAALSLILFGDNSGSPHIVALLQPA